MFYELCFLPKPGEQLRFVKYNRLQKANILTVLNKLGIKATLDKDGNLKLPDETQVTVSEEKPEAVALKP